MRKLALALVTAALSWPAAAGAQSEQVFSVEGVNAAGPAKYDRVMVRRIGSPTAENVLVLVPGFIGGAADFAQLGRDLVKRVPDLQVWALDRRSNALEDTSVFATGDPDKAFDYYLNFKEVEGRKFTPVDGKKDATFARDWGLEVALEDLRRVVLRARSAGKRKVILGGHSLGASTAVIYATWDFGGRPGYRDVEGLVLIDGGALGTFAVPTLARVKRVLKEIDAGDPFADLLGLGLPWAAGVFAESGALFAAKKPDEPSVLQGYPLLPDNLKAPFRLTNEAAFGYAFDQTTSPKGLELIRVRAGRVAATGDPRPWEDGEVSPIQRVAATFANEPLNGIEWYFPRKLTLDVDGADGLEQNAITRFLRLRTRHLKDVDVPLYAFQTDLTPGRVIRGARRFVARSDVPRAAFINEPENSHLDPLTAAPRKSRFLKTVVPFLKSLK